MHLHVDGRLLRASSQMGEVRPDGISAAEGMLRGSNSIATSAKPNPCGVIWTTRAPTTQNRKHQCNGLRSMSGAKCSPSDVSICGFRCSHCDWGLIYPERHLGSQRMAYPTESLGPRCSTSASLLDSVEDHCINGRHVNAEATPLRCSHCYWGLCYSKRRQESQCMKYSTWSLGPKCPQGF